MSGILIPQKEHVPSMGHLGLSVIVLHNNSLQVAYVTKEAHDAEVERTRKLPNTLYAFDYWSERWERKW